MWNTACLDWEDRLLSGRSLVPDLPLFIDERDKALRIFNRLKLPDVIDLPTMEKAAGDWFRDIVAALFGSYDVSQNRRMIQELFLLVPKKNGKSSYAAAVMVTAMIVNRRPNAEYLLIAPTMEIAGISYKQAKGIIQADQELAKVFHLQDHQKTITHRKSGAELKIKAADTDVITGSKSTGILVDETHVFAKKPNAADIFVEIRGALAARPDGFMIQITTQSKAPPIGVFKAELGIARDVRDGLIQVPRLAVLYELPARLAKDDGWTRRDLWPFINPNLGRSVDLAFLETQLLLAERADDPLPAMALLASQHFNVEIGQSLRGDRWVGAKYWPTTIEPCLTLQTLIDRCEVAVVGIDGGGLDDLLGLCVIGREKLTGVWLMWFKAWMQPDVLEQRKSEASALQDFVSAGDLVLCDGDTQDIEEVADIVEELNDAGLLPEKDAVGLDPAGVAAMVDEISSRGITDEQLAGVPQGYRLNGAIKGLARRLRAKTAKHNGSPMMAWCVGNAKVEARGNAVLITKQTAGTAKIDPLCAGFNGVELMGRNPTAARPASVYRQRGLLML